MKHKPRILHFFLFFIALSHPAINSLSFAASIKNEVAPTASSKQEPSNKNRRLSKNEAYIDYYYSTLEFVQPTDFIAPSYNSSHTPPYKDRTDTTNNSSAVFNNNLYKVGKKILASNKENGFIQGSLLVFSNTKQFLKETDLMLYNLTENILLSIKLDFLIGNSQFAKQDAMTKNMSQNAYSNDNLSTFSYQNQDGSFQARNIEHDTAESSGGEGGGFRDLIKKLLSLENLFYLIGAIIFYAILSMAIKFMLVEKPPK